MLASIPSAANPTSPELFPRRSLAEFPKSKNTADYVGEAEADDGHRYYMKEDKDGKPVRASEWLGTFLAETVGIAAPAGKMIKRLNGEIVFGSRRVIGVADEVETRNILHTPSLIEASQSALGIKATLSQIYALDLFIFNDDRHFGNYLSIDDAGVRRFFAYDFSRAVFWQWPWQGVPAPGCHTRTHGQLIRRLHGFDIVAAKNVLDHLESISAALVEAEMRRLPAEWISAPLKEEFSTWWRSSARMERAKEIKAGVENGTYL